MGNFLRKYTLSKLTTAKIKRNTTKEKPLQKSSRFEGFTEKFYQHVAGQSPSANFPSTLKVFFRLLGKRPNSL